MKLLSTLDLMNFFLKLEMQMLNAIQWGTGNAIQSFQSYKNLFIMLIFIILNLNC